MSTILLLGGTGAMGVYLAEILAEMGHRVVVTSRSARPSTPQITYVQGNAHDEGFLRQCLAETRPAAIVDFMSYDTAAFRARVDTLLAASEHYIFLSSYRVYNEQVPLTEASPRLLDSCADADYLATDEYGLAKARQEDLLQARRNPARWTIVRPGITYSKARFQFGCLEANNVVWRALRGLPLVMPPEMLAKRTTLTWGKDVATMIARLLLRPEAMGEVYTVASSESHTWREVFAIYEKALGATLVECSLEDYIRIVGTRAQVLYDRMFERVVDNSKVLAATGLRQADLTPLSEGLTRELEQFKAAAHPLVPAVERNARIDAVLGSYASLGDYTFAQEVLYWQVRHPLLFNNLAIRAVRKAFRILLRGIRR